MSSVAAVLLLWPLRRLLAADCRLLLSAQFLYPLLFLLPLDRSNFLPLLWM